MSRLLSTVVALGAALLLTAGARGLSWQANHLRDRWPATLDPPYAPSPGSARFLSLGYREAWADWLWIRALGYFGGDEKRAASTRALIEAINSLDPRYHRAYAWGGKAITAVGTGATEDDYLAAIAILERGAREFPDDYELPDYIGKLYTSLDLRADDPVKARRWQEEGARWLERAVRTPGAPTGMATVAAHLRTKLGQREQAVRDLRELILYTSDRDQRDKLIKKLATLQGESSDAIRYEIDVMSKRFEDRWDRERPELPPSSYLLVGPPLAPYFEPDDLAVDRDLIGTEPPIEPLEPVPD
jgi:hypothetical protein